MLPFSKVKTRKLVDLDYDFVGKPFTPKVETKQEAKDVRISPTDDGILQNRRGGFSQRVARSRGKKRGKKKMLARLPPTIDLVPACHAVMRFLSNNATNTSVTFSELLGICGGICTVVNSTVVGWASSVRIHRITIWPSASSSGVNFANVTWVGDTASSVAWGKDTVRDASIPEGTTLTAPFTTVPPKGTLCDQWLTPSSTTCFNIASSIGSVVDVDVSWTLTGQQSIQPTFTVATGVVGNIYYLPLDGASSHRYQNIALPATF